jgi:hypothetical protein
MIPCKFCLPLRNGSVKLKGLKEVGKTRYSGTRYVRRYRCKDCGAIRTLRGELGRPDNSSSCFRGEWSQPN